MAAKSTPENMAASAQSSAERRRYDSPLRRQRAVETRARIVTAGADIVHSLQSWDWRELTFRAVAKEAGVSESTVFRHFANERELHDAVMQRLHEQAGVSYERVALDEVADVADRVFSSLSAFAALPLTLEVDDPAFATADVARKSALRAAMEDAAPDWSDRQREATAGILDVLWSPAGYEQLVRQWQLDPDQAAGAIRWVIGLVVNSVQNGTPPIGPSPGSPAGAL
jgi:AcrR family transcriptional regulator